MRTVKLKLTAAAVASVVLLGLAGTVAGWPQPGLPVAAVAAPDLPRRTIAPAADDLPTAGDWTPKNNDPVPTAFPDLKPADNVDFVKVCPRVFGKTAVVVDPADDTYRRLLKARLHQGVMEAALFYNRIQVGQYQIREDLPPHLRCLDDMRTVTLELWANDPKTLIPWLEEFVLLAKVWESRARMRVQAGPGLPEMLNAACRRRLEAETVLWKVKNPKPGGR